jgi:hypothetical protein
MCPSSDSSAVESTTKANSESDAIKVVIESTSITTDSSDNASGEPDAIETKQLQNDGTKSLSVLAQASNQNDLNQYANDDSDRNNPEGDTQNSLTMENIG